MRSIQCGVEFGAPTGHLLKATVRRELVDRSPDLPGAR